MRKVQFFFGTLILVFGGFRSFAQTQETKIVLKNPSFEDVPRHSQTPREWIDCGFPGESEPDVQPSGDFGVTLPAQHGETYLGLVVRDNETWERVSQKMSQPLEKGKCYEFSIYLARSSNYISKSQVRDLLTNYVTPAKLRIYGGFSSCDRQITLAESSLVSNYRWQEYRFKFEPNDNFTYITFEAFYKTPNLFPYNGNILLDNASPITMVPCKENPVVVKQPPVKPPVKVDTPKTNTGTTSSVKNNNTVPVPPIKKVETPPANPIVKSNKPLESPNLDTIKSSSLSKGQTLRIRSIIFNTNDTTLNRGSFADLDKLNNFLKQNQKVVIEIGGHTNGLCDDAYCNSLSLRRAQAVANYLIKNGTAADRLQVKGYGKTQPLSTTKPDPLNQRVEIKILDL